AHQRPGPRRRRLWQDAQRRAHPHGKLGSRGQYRSARHLSGRPRRRCADGRTRARINRQYRLRRRHDLRSDPRLHRGQGRRYSTDPDACRRMGPIGCSRQCGLSRFYPNGGVTGRYRFRRDERRTYVAQCRDGPARRPDRSGAGHRVAAWTGEQRGDRDQSSGGCRLFCRRNLGCLWRSTRPESKIIILGNPGAPSQTRAKMMNIALTPGKHDLASAIAEADIRVLLMVLVHMSGDLRWLEPPYAPRRDARLIPDPKAGLPENIQDEIRAAALKLLRDGSAKPVITDPGDDLMRRMMSVTLGEVVAPEYAPLIREEMGLIPRDARWSTEPPPSEQLHERHVLIVGAGV